MSKLKDIYNKNLFIIKLVWKYCKLYIIATIAISFSSILTPVSDVLAPKYIIDFLQKRKPFIWIIAIIFFIFLIESIKSIYYSWYNNYLVPKSQNKIKNGINYELMKKAASLDLKCYEDSEFYNKYTRALKEADIRAMLVINSLKEFVLSAVYIITLLGIIIFMDPILLFIAFISMIVPTIFSVILGKYQYKYDRKLTSYEKYTNYIKRVFYEVQYSKEIRIFSLNELFLKKYNENTKHIDKELTKKGKKISTLTIISELLEFSIDIIILMGYLAWKIYNGMLSLGDFTALYIACRQLSTRLQSFSNTFSKFYEHSLYISNLKEVLDYENEIISNDKEIDEEIKNIRIKNLSFSYTKTNILENISLNVEKGEKISIVGFNGAGKSTLIKLILRLYDIKDGEILINNEKIKNVPIEQLRNRIGLVFQDFQLYSVSVAENILLREVNDVKDENIVWKALEKVGLYEKIKKLPNNIHTLVTKEFSSDGIVFSGGEAQKLALARVFVKNYDVIILDEPSSALDPLSEKQMYENIMSIADNKIIIFITHRLSTTVMADRIYLITNGKVVEKGNHNELMSINGCYKKMFDAQSEYYIER